MLHFPLRGLYTAILVTLATLLNAASLPRCRLRLAYPPASACCSTLQAGTLRQGDVVSCGACYGKVRLLAVFFVCSIDVPPCAHTLLHAALRAVSARCMCAAQ